jgi:putative tricarboxylic transport membrane protein
MASEAIPIDRLINTLHIIHLVDGEMILAATSQMNMEVINQAFDIFIRNVHWVVIGTIVAMLIGIVPGLGGAVALAILIPFTLSMDKFSAFALLTAAVGGTTFAGSITAMLISIPGSSSNVATLLDGYPLTRQGEARWAIASSAIASASGAIVGVVIFLISVPFLLEFAILMGPSEIFWLILFALILIPVITGDRPFLGIIMAIFGGLLAYIGYSPQTGQPRMTFGLLQLEDGISLIAVVNGLFAYAELIRLASNNREVLVDLDVFSEKSALGEFFRSLRTIYEHKLLVVRSSIIGILVGAIPGPGGSASSFIAYLAAVHTSRNKDKFTKGNIEGVIASEASNDSKDGGQLIPTLGLGIPGTASMAIFLGAMLIHGITPSPQIIANELTLIVVIAFCLLASNILSSVLGLIFLKPLSRILTIPTSIFIPVLITIITVSTYIFRNSMFDVLVAIVVGVFAVILLYLNISRVGFLVAFLLAGLLERNYYLLVRFARGDVIEGLFGSPLSQGIIIVFIITNLAYIYTEYYR